MRPEGTGWQSKRDRPTKAERQLARRQADYDGQATTPPGTRRPGSLNRNKK